MLASGGIDATADVDAEAELGPGVSVGAGTRVRAGARVGRDVFIGRDALVDAGVGVGDGSTIHDRALIYSGAGIGSGVFVGPGAIVTNERYPRAVLTTADTAKPPEHETVTLEDGVTIGAGAVIVSGVRVGRHAFVGAGGIVTADVPAHALVAGNPARRLGWVCACGRRLVDANGDPAPAEPAQYSRFPDLTCPVCGRVYAYVPDADTLEERSGPRSGVPA
jgi:UDP-2-acetamido-3-amino-2,3-dideoxy-glucuronate N-acetyltransferase